MKKRSQPVSKKRRSVPRGAASNNHLKVAISEKEIRRRVRELAKQIDRDYQGKTLLVVGVLENCLMFMADLVRDLTIPVAYSFIRSQVRDSDSGLVAMREITYIPPVNLEGKDLLLVDGVLQSGVTLDYLCRTLLAQRPASLRIATLLDKNDERKVDVPVDYAGFKVSGKFLVGYGLGYQDQYRSLPYLAHMIERQTATRRAAARI
jgi:hypoxanthine phosphoribosyltransferase